jgi:NADH-quinone oxidoreductase subunit L
MAWPVTLLAVPSAVLGFAALAPGFAQALGAPPGEKFTIGPEVAAPLVWVALGFAAAWWLWRSRPDADPIRVAGPLRPVFANAFYLDAVQDALVVRPVTTLARWVRRLDESLVDGAVEGTGRGTVRLGAVVARMHRASLQRAVSAVLGGAALLGIVAVVIGVWS